MKSQKSSIRWILFQCILICLCPVIGILKIIGGKRRHMETKFRAKTINEDLNFGRIRIHMSSSFYSSNYLFHFIVVGVNIFSRKLFSLSELGKPFCFQGSSSKLLYKNR